MAKRTQQHACLTFVEPSNSSVLFYFRNEFSQEHFKFFATLVRSVINYFLCHGKFALQEFCVVLNAYHCNFLCSKFFILCISRKMVGKVVVFV